MAISVLLCDDEVHILRASEFKFARAGFDVRCANDGEEGWQAIQERQPDIVITDCQMPRLDGLGLAKRIHDDPTTTHIPVLMLTGKGFEIPRTDKWKECGIVEVLPKPFSPRELLAKAQLLLGQTVGAE
ncbi:MAG TPA: response regulator [Tepidisphaeraceae bacterium]|nr:response regulator [Tepidisphaeraceae bacterium]